MAIVNLEVSKITEMAALATFDQIGLGNKENADKKAVEAMEYVLNAMDISAEVVIGEGEIDEAPMLYIGQKLGRGGPEYDIAVDPIDGTRMVAEGMSNAIAVIALSRKGSLLKAPDMYMEKLVVNSQAKNQIDIELSLEENVRNVASYMQKSLSEMTVMVLAKPRHFKDIEMLQKLGVKVISLSDGDIEGTLIVALAEKGIDMFYGIGGAPEGVISAAIVRALDGDMQARLLSRVDAKGGNLENIVKAREELHRCQEMNIEIDKKLLLTDMVTGSDFTVSLTGITGSELIEEVQIHGNSGTTETIVIDGGKNIRRIKTIHNLDEDAKLKKIIKGE